MPTLQVRDLPDEVCAQLAYLADKEHRSLSQETIAVLKEENVLDKAEAKGFREHLSASDLVPAPEIFTSEITNAFWKYGLYSGLESEKCEKGIDYRLDLVDDLFFLVPARRNGASILTKNKKLRKLARKLRIKTLGGH